MATFVHTFNDGDVPVSLFQNSVNSFKVIYGAQIKSGLSYAEAAKEYGECVFHSLSCADLIDVNVFDK